MLVVLIVIALVLWALGPTGRAALGILIVVLVLWAMAAPSKPRPWVEGTYADGTPLPPLPPPSEPMYDESGRPNSHGKVLVLPGVMAMHHPDRPVAQRKHQARGAGEARHLMSADDFMKSMSRYPTCVRDGNHRAVRGHEAACDREIRLEAGFPS